MKIMTYNVCVHHASEEGDYQRFAWARREPAIMAAITREAPDIVFIQEAPQWRPGAFESALPEYLWCFERQHSRGGRFASIGVGVRRALPVPDFVLLDSRPDVVLGETILAALWPGQLLALAIHFPTDDGARQGMAECLDRLIAPLGKQPIVVGGDFNAFPSRGGPRQLEIVCQRSGLNNATTGACRTSDGQPATSSFLGFPYDVVPPELLAVPGKLDHIMVSKSLKASHPRVVDDLDTPFSDHWPSDHAPLTLEVTVSVT